MEKVKINDLSSTVSEFLEEYKEVATDVMKDGINDTGKFVRNEIRKNAPVKSGKYKKSWSIKKLSETSSKLEIVVYSKGRYRIAHLLEHGHAKRGGGRVAGKEHIAPAEAKGEKFLLDELKRGM